MHIDRQMDKITEGTESQAEKLTDRQRFILPPLYVVVGATGYLIEYNYNIFSVDRNKLS